MIYAMFLVAYLVVAGFKFYKNKEFYMARKDWALTAFLVDVGCWMFVAYFVTEMLKM